jgi:ketosteroid isomerase-like protein
MIDRNMLMFANDSFYHAFANRDLAGMDEVWAKNAAVCCIHPGWAALIDREDVMTSWQAIMENPDSPDIEHYNADAYIFGDSAFVVCYERIPGGVMAATNFFVEEAGRIRLVHHQATPCQNPPQEEETLSGNVQ